MNYYNEFDPRAAAWLRELIKQGHITEGVVDERSIRDVQPADLAGYDQCHFFAGIGGWSLALQLAGVPSNQRVWTGSCPCQPFSLAGKQKGTADERHLWPDFNRLIQACKPPLVFGEQVDAAIRHGWLDGVFTDLEAGGYACGAVDLPAASVGAPHIRQRILWVSHTGTLERERRKSEQQPIGENQTERNEEITDAERSDPALWLAEPGENGRVLLHEDGDDVETLVDETRCSPFRGGTKTAWDSYHTVYCRDGKARRFEPGSFPLAHGVPARMGRLRGYGNAIVPQVAAVFIEEALNAIEGE